MAIDSDLKNYLKAVRIGHDERIDANYMRKGTLPEYSVATSLQSGLMSAEDKQKLDGINPGASDFTLQPASADSLGGVKITGNDGLIMQDGVLKVADSLPSSNSNSINVSSANDNVTLLAGNSNSHDSLSISSNGSVLSVTGIYNDGGNQHTFITEKFSTAEKNKLATLNNTDAATISKSDLDAILAKFNVTVYTPPEPDTTPADTTPADTTPADTVSATPPSDLTFAAVYTNPSTLTVFAGEDDTYAVTVSVHIANPNYYDASTWGTNQPCQLDAYTENGFTELEVLDPEEMDDDYNVTEHIISDISYLGLSVDTGSMLVADYRVTLFDPSYNYDYSVFSIFFSANNLAGTGSRQSNPLYAYVADPRDPM